MDKQLSLYDFLIKVTNIPKTFIKNHLKFYNNCEKEPFGINLNDVIEYLEIEKKDSYIARVKEKFKENVDYVRIEKKNIFNKKGTQKIFYYITLDTFEQLCMLSRTKTGDKVRSYFITMRKFINYYRDNIYNMILHSDCVVYILLVNKGKNIYKIGKSCDLRKRLATYTTGRDTHPDIEFIIQVDKPHSVETCSKAVLLDNNYQKGKELYKVNIDSIKTAIFNCATNVKEVNKLNLEKMDSYVLFSSKLDEKNPKKISKKSSKKLSKKSSKKLSKKTNIVKPKKISKKVTKKVTKKL